MVVVTKGWHLNIVLGQMFLYAFVFLCGICIRAFFVSHFVFVCVVNVLAVLFDVMK